MKKLLDYLNKDKEVLEISFQEEYKEEQKKYPSLNPMTLNNELMKLITLLPLDRLGEKGKFFFDDSKSMKKVIAKTLSKSKINNFNILKKGKELSEIKRTINFRRNSIFKSTKTNLPSINNFYPHDKKRLSFNVNSLTYRENNNFQRSNKNKLTVSCKINEIKKKMYFEKMIESSKEFKKKPLRRFSMLLMEKNKKKFKL